MKRQLCLSILLAAMAAPATYAGADIVKCVDGAGRVTLTDQPCESGAVIKRLTTADQGITRAAPQPPAIERAVLPPPPRRYAAPRAKLKPMMRDVATLKEARAQFLLGDAMGKQTLATLD
ncbi:MAG: DUF4124 domain-containing protein [Telluria sp.]